MRGMTAAGFTLIEIIIVMAISSLMLAMVFAGQQQLRARAQFDAQVNKFVATVSDAHNQATAGVNIIGGGDGTSGCGPGGPGGQYVFAGTAWTIDNFAPTLVTMDYYKALPGVKACKFSSQTSDLSSLEISQVNGVAGSEARLLFVRTDTGGLEICGSNSATPNNELASFKLGACSGGPAAGNMTIQVRDKNNSAITSDIFIDKSGLAKRNN
jgi:prepilin-type N-terminal cleavage/methylation domain-containing protein